MGGEQGDPASGEERRSESLVESREERRSLSVAGRICGCLARAVYRALLLAYPAEFRRRDGVEAARTFEYACRGSWRRRGLRGVVGRLAHALGDVPRRGLRERWASRDGGSPAGGSSAGLSALPPGPATLPAGLATLLSGLLLDACHAVRSLARRPGFTVAIVTTLALGIGANTAIFGVVDATLLRPLPYPDAHRIVYVGARTVDGDSSRLATLDQLQRWAARVDAFERLEAYSGRSVVLSGEGAATWVGKLAVTPGFLAALGIEPLAGRFPTADDGRPDAEPVVVMAEGLWRRRFGAARDIVGRTIVLDGIAHVVIGIAPEVPGWGNDLYAPLPVSGQAARTTTARGVAWLERGVPIDAARARLEAASAGRDDQGREIVGDIERPGNIFWTSEEYRVSLLALMGAVFVVLAIACVNVANLMLASGGARGGEIAVRSALGASPFRIARLLLTESLLLALAGGAIGTLVALVAVDLMAALGPGAQLQDRLAAVRVDGLVVGYALLVTTLTGLAFGAVPALRAATTGHREALQRADRRDGGGRGRLGVGLVAAEVAVSMVLLICAGLVLRAFVQLRFTDPGFDADRVLSVRISLPEDRYPSLERQAAFFDALAAEASRLPGVTAVSLGYGAVPPSDLVTRGDLEIEGGGSDDLVGISPMVSFVEPGYFDLMGIPLLAGRDFAAAELRAGSAAEPPVVVSNAMARRFWPAGSAVGSRFRIVGFRDGQWHRVVGVAGDVTDRDLLAPACEACAWRIYLPLEAERRFTDVLLRLAEGARPPVTGLRAAVARIDPQVAADDGLETAAAGLLDHIREPRFRAVLLATFAALALILAALGIFGVVSSTVGRRTREMGIRLALGARPVEVRRLVLAQGMAPVGVGLALGVAGALVVTRAMEGLLYGISPMDPLTLLATLSGLAGVGLLATWIPARRATRVDPVLALRSE